MRTNPAALERRMRAGPLAETRTLQRIVLTVLFVCFPAIFVVSALDHRFGWSPVPATVSLIGDVLVGIGLGVAMMVLIQNSYASVNVTVEAGQRLVSTGLYGLVRHPMYTGNVILMVGVPLALGSYWGLVLVVPGLFVLALRIRDEEDLLEHELSGYREYTQQVRYRLVPYVW
jgi:protein-S-isoprenylcysteine O-methyltransferase Ste14